MENVQIVLELPKPAYEFLKKAIKSDKKVYRLLQDEFKISLRSLFESTAGIVVSEGS